MHVYIIGKNTARLGRIRKGELDKHFFASRGQLYKVYPEAVARLHRTKYGVELDNEEVIIYSENSTIPWKTNEVDYSADKVLSEIDEHKLVNYGGTVKKNPIGRLLRDKNLGNNMVWILAGIVLAGAFISQVIG